MGAIVHADHGQGQIETYHSFDPPSVIQSSRQRCVELYGLDPHTLPPPTILSSTDVADHRQPIDNLLYLAKDEIDRLFLRLRDHRFAVTFSNETGVTLFMRCAQEDWDHYKSAGLIIGSIWSEESQGTNGIGTGIKEGRPLSIVMDDHFSNELSTVSCTVAPVFGAQQSLKGILNVTTIVPTTHDMQTMVRDIVHRSARRIENIYFDERHDRRTVFRLSRQSDFNDLAWEERFAVGTDGRIIEATPGAMRMLRRVSDSVINLPLDEILRQSRPSPDASSAQGTVLTTLDDGSRFFLKPLQDRHPASAPSPVKKRSPSPSSKEKIDPIETVLGNDPHMLERFAVIQRLINRRLPVLLQGETGSGKSTLAKILHRNSTHASGAFVSLNCAAIPPDLIESELFGYRSGAFTGASRQGSRGRLLEADGGTLFLDEIGDMPLSLQTRFLHVLSDGEFVPVGSTHPVKIEVAVISASHHNIAALVRSGQFREDLYFRLNGATRTLPPLRDRLDKQLIFEHVFREEAALIGQPQMKIDNDVYRILDAYHWPGNLRELRHVAKFAITVADEKGVTLACLPDPFNTETAPTRTHTTDENSAERRILWTTLDQLNWNVSETAKRLRISRSTLHRKMKALNLKRSIPEL